MLQVLAIVVAVLAALSWLSALVHAALLLPHRRDDLSMLGLVFRGYLFYSPDTWKPSGQPLHRRFLGFLLSFFAFVVIAALLAAIGASRSI